MGLPILTLTPTSSGYTSKDVASTLSVQYDGGAGLYRSGKAGNPNIVGVTWNLGPADYRTLTAFYNTILNNGTKSFLINLIIDSVYTVQTQHTVKFVPQTFKLNSVQGHTYQVSAELEVIPIQLAAWEYSQVINGKDVTQAVCDAITHLATVALPAYL
jgi:hypothetical protein